MECGSRAPTFSERSRASLVVHESVRRLLGISGDDGWSGFCIDPVDHSGDLPLPRGLLPERHQVHVIWVNGNKAPFARFSFFLFGYFQQEPEIGIELLPFREGTFFLRIDDLRFRRSVQFLLPKREQGE